MPKASSNEGAGERNQNLPGLGGVFNSRNLQTYHYAGNNPLRYVDPSGKVIVLNNRSEEDRQAILSDINSKSLIQYKLDSNNKLIVDKEATKRVKVEEKQRIKDGQAPTRSAQYSKQLEALRKSKTTTFIRIAERDNKINGISETTQSIDSGGGFTYTDRDGNVHVVLHYRGAVEYGSLIRGISGDYLNQDRSEVLIHEIAAHAYPRVKHNYDPEKGQTIDPIAEENKIRKELGLDLREEDPKHDPAY